MICLFLFLPLKQVFYIINAIISPGFLAGKRLEKTLSSGSRFTGTRNDFFLVWLKMLPNGFQCLIVLQQGLVDLCHPFEQQYNEGVVSTILSSTL